ncbi:MAG: hypothetical protein B6D41_08180 [Chloroflexi bacterium UTCFX4]|nr:MAG: hypothetical protein B6D41_08180 [Chloroflexi bacterium UTCFX4]
MGGWVEKARLRAKYRTAILFRVLVFWWIVWIIARGIWRLLNLARVLSRVSGNQIGFGNECDWQSLRKISGPMTNWQSFEAPDAGAYK